MEGCATNWTTTAGYSYCHCDGDGECDGDGDGNGNGDVDGDGVANLGLTLRNFHTLVLTWLNLAKLG